MADPQNPWAVVKSEPSPAANPWSVVKSEQTPPTVQSGPGEPQTFETVLSHLAQVPIGLWSIAKAIGKTATGDPSDLVSMAKNFGAADAQNRGQILPLLSRATQEPLASRGQLADVLEAGGRTAAMLMPALGLPAVHAGQEIGRSNFAGGLTDAATQIAPMGMTDAVNAASRGMMGAAIPTSPQLAKYGNLAQPALDEGITMTKAGQSSALANVGALRAAKINALKNTGATVPAADVADPAIRLTNPAVEMEVRAGLRPMGDNPTASTGFLATNPPEIPADELDAIRSVWNNARGPALAAKARGTPLPADPTELANLAGSSGDALSKVLPDYVSRNADIMQQMGLARAAGMASKNNRLNMNLYDLGLGGAGAFEAGYPALGIPAALLLRALRTPAALSGSAIGLSRMAPTIDPAMRAAIIQQLSSPSPTSGGGSQ